MALLSLVVSLLAVLTSTSSLVSAQTCSTAGLPTSNGPWNVTSGPFNATVVAAWPVVGWGGVQDSHIVATVAPLTGQYGTVYPTGTWVWYGTHALVQMSTDQGLTWTAVDYGNDYNETTGNAQCAHRGSYNRFYVMGDEVNGVETNTSQAVYASTNGYVWNQVLSPTTAAAWQAAGRLQAWGGCVVDAQDRVYSLGDSDVWVSNNNGSLFTNVTTSSIYSPRSFFAYGIFTASMGDVMVVAGGTLAATQGNLNDVWASQTGGASWIRMTAAAPWSPRQNPNLAISSNGVMVLQGGRGYVTSQYWLADAWVSLDGGATWSLLVGNSGFNKTAAATMLDAQGYLYLFGGETLQYNWTYSAVKSTYGLNNIQSWTPSATASALVIPSTFTACTPYYNVVQPTPASSSSAAARASSSSSSTGVAPVVNATTGASSSSTGVAARSSSSSGAATSAPVVTVSSSVVPAGTPSSSSGSVSTGSPSTPSTGPSTTTPSPSVSSSAAPIITATPSSSTGSTVNPPTTANSASTTQSALLFTILGSAILALLA